MTPYDFPQCFWDSPMFVKGHFVTFWVTILIWFYLREWMCNPIYETYWINLLSTYWILHPNELESYIFMAIVCQIKVMTHCEFHLEICPPIMLLNFSISLWRPSWIISHCGIPHNHNVLLGICDVIIFLNGINILCYFSIITWHFENHCGYNMPN